MISTSTSLLLSSAAIEASVTVESMHSKASSIACSPKFSSNSSISTAAASKLRTFH